MMPLDHFLIFSVLFRICLAKPRVLLIAVSNINLDYIEKYNLTGFRFVAETGIYSKWGMKPSFFTQTISNLYTIATGLYPENHGIIADYMWDSKMNKSFSYIRSKEPIWWEGGEPIWVTAKKQGKRVSVYNWPGADIKIHGIYPDMFLRGYTFIPSKDYIDTAVDWFGDDDADLVLMQMNSLYQFSNLLMIERKIRLINDALIYLFYRLANDFLLEEVNVIVVSDHGSVNISATSRNLIRLSNYVDVRDIAHYGSGGGSMGIWPKPNKTEILYQQLLRAFPKMIVYKKEKISEELHIKKHERCPPLLLLAEEGYYIQSFFDYRHLINHFIITSGYNPKIMDLRAIFYASGPFFKKNYFINDLDSVNIYSIICHILDLKPSAHNGSWKDVKHMFAEPINHDHKSNGIKIVGSSLVFLMLQGIYLAFY